MSHYNQMNSSTYSAQDTSCMHSDKSKSQCSHHHNNRFRGFDFGDFNDKNFNRAKL